METQPPNEDTVIHIGRAMFQVQKPTTGYQEVQEEFRCMKIERKLRFMQEARKVSLGHGASKTRPEKPLP